MRHIYTASRALLCSGVLALFTPSLTYADPACDAEVATIRAALAAPAENISSGDLEEAQRLFKILEEDCNGGTPLKVVAPIAEQVRALLRMSKP